MNKSHLPAEVLEHFRLDGEVVSIKPFGNGNINDTFKVETTQSAYLLQRINRNVFKNPQQVMHNLGRVSEHMKQKLCGHPDIRRRVLHFADAKDGKNFVEDKQGNVWRTYLFVDRVHAYEVLENAEQAYQAGRAFARFQNTLLDLPEPRLYETIPFFHHAPKRLEAFRESVRVDALHRADSVRPEIAFVESRVSLCSHLVDRMERGELPERIVHNDTKINNVLLDVETNRGVCVIDLDTVMPGLALFDFGDLVRSAASLTAEDEIDLSKVGIDYERYEAIVKGYLEEAPFLTAEERSEMVFAIKNIVFVLGLRFLTDYLNGDTYFKIKIPEHNIIRARVQFRLLEVLEEQTDHLQSVINRYQATVA